MIIRFSMENYTSFKERQIFSMVASKHTRHLNHIIKVDDKRLLKSSYFFGGNAAGKSNFIRGVDFMRRLVIHGISGVGFNDKYFKVDESYKSKPGVFQMDYMVDDIVYSYGFAYDYLNREFVSEWLYRIDSSTKEVCIFNRNKSKEIESQVKLGDEKTRFEIYTNDLKDNELLLKVLSDKNIESTSPLYDFVKAYNWFKKLVVVYPESHLNDKFGYYLGSETDSSKLSELLHAFDTGVEGFNKAKMPADKAFSYLPENIKLELLSDLEQELRMKEKEGKKFKIKTSDDKQFVVYFENDILYADKLMMNHGNSDELFDFIEESDGTQRLFDLIPLYDEAMSEKIILVDELDRSFHAKLTRQYLDYFYKISENLMSQLICTTHDLSLMDLNFLRQDEIWFVERDTDHSSKIYSLTEFKQRFDTNILDAYILGRYGAIPCFKDDDLMGENNE